MKTACESRGGSVSTERLDKGTTLNTRRITGEPLEAIFPIAIEKVSVFGVTVYRLIGNEKEISDTTAIMDKAWADGDKVCFGDAIPIGVDYKPESRERIVVYELIVIRKDAT